MMRISTKILLSLLAIVILAPASIGAQTPTPPESIDLRVEKQPLLVLLERVARQCGVGLVVRAGLDDEMLERTTIYAKDAKWSDAVELFRNQFKIDVQLTEKRIVVTSIDDAFRERLRRDYYPTDPIVRALENYRSPRLGIGWENWDDYGGGGGILDLESEEAPAIEDLPGLIRAATGGDEAWDRDGVILEQRKGVLVVRQVPEVHEALRTFLKQLEATSARQAICRIHALSIRDALSPILSAEEYAPLIANQKPIAVFVVADGQTNHHYVGVESRVTIDAESVDPVIDPVVAPLLEGFALELNTHVTRDGVLSSFWAQACERRSSRAFPLSDEKGEPYLHLELSDLDQKHGSDTRLVPTGGGTLLRLGDAIYGVSFEVLP